MIVLISNRYLRNLSKLDAPPKKGLTNVEEKPQAMYGTVIKVFF